MNKTNIRRFLYINGPQVAAAATVLAMVGVTVLYWAVLIISKGV